MDSKTILEYFQLVLERIEIINERNSFVTKRDRIKQNDIKIGVLLFPEEEERIHLMYKNIDWDNLIKYEKEIKTEIRKLKIKNI
jgi:hypothetical protein